MKIQDFTKKELIEIIKGLLDVANGRVICQKCLT